MIVYLEDQVAAGKPITKELIEGAIDLYSPGASGGSAYTQRAMIANTWNRGDEVFNAYKDKMAWAKKCFLNVCNAGIFSSDRTILQYADEIWDVKRTENK